MVWRHPNQTTDFLMQWMEAPRPVGAQSLQKKRLIRVAIEPCKTCTTTQFHTIPSKISIYATASAAWRIETYNAIDSRSAVELQQTWETLKSKCQRTPLHAA